MEEIDNLDPDDGYYTRRKADLDDRLYRMYDKIEEIEEPLMTARAKKTSIEAEKITGDNIYKMLIYFDKLYFAMNDVERRQLIEALINEIQIYEECKPNGQWLKSIRFKLPIIENDLSIGLDNEWERIYTDAIKDNLKTAKQWKDENSTVKRNVRDAATLNQLLVLVNPESYNAVLTCCKKGEK